MIKPPKPDLTNKLYQHETPKRIKGRDDLVVQEVASYGGTGGGGASFIGDGN